MAKLEEIAELLTEEILSFQKLVEELKNQQELLSNKKIIIDTTSIEIKLKESISTLEQINSHHIKEVKTLNNRIKNSFTIPKWVLIGNFTIIALLLVSLSFNIYFDKKMEKVEKVAFQNGVDSFKDHLRKFFEEDPSSYKNYKTWDKNLKK